MLRHELAPLDTLIAELRVELAAELPLKLHAYQPSNGRHTHGGAAEPSGDDIEQEQPRPTSRYYNPGMTGLEFSRAFDRYLSGNHGGDFLAADTFVHIRDECRRDHWREAHTGDDPFAWNLCSRLAIAAVELRQPLSFIAVQEDIDVWLVRNLLITALQEAADWRADRRKGVIIGDESRRQLDESEALPVVLAREHSIAHEQRVWELWRERFPYVRSWESELQRRRAYHAKHCHERCALLMGEAA
jgi:hypothetical protein